jgi:hypothetical protein
VTRDQPIAAIQATAVVCGLPLVAAAIAWADGAWTLLGFGLAALGLLWWWIVKIAPQYRIDPETANEFSPAPAKWVDIWATRDLVPDGGLENPTADSQPVCNTRSALGDHSSYHRNPEVLAELLAAMTDEVDLASLKTVVGDIRPRWYFWRRIAAAAAALSVCVRLVLSDRWQLVGHGLVISTYFAWSRAEFTWRLRRQRQLAPRSAGPFRWWVADSRDPLSYPTLVASMLAGMALATVLGTTPPATIRLDTAPGVSAGFGSPRALLSSIGAYVLTIAVYLVIRRVRSRSQSTG